MKKKNANDGHPPSFAWYPRDIRASLAGESDAFELAYRRALDASWDEKAYGVGTPEDWCRWGRVSAEDRGHFLDRLSGHVLQCPDGTLVQMRLVLERYGQVLRHRKATFDGSLANRKSNDINGGQPESGHPVATLQAPYSHPDAGGLGASPHAFAFASAVESKDNPPTAPPAPDRPAPARSRSLSARSSRKAEHPAFAEFYERAYPRRTKRPRAAKAFAAALARHPDWTAEDLIEAARSFAAMVRQKPEEFIPHPATWLNDDQFTEEVSHVTDDARGAEFNPADF